MPTCSRIVTLLVDYIEERLSRDVRLDLKRHLAGCSACAAALATYSSTISLLGSLTEDDLPPELRFRLHAFLEQRSTN